MKNTSIFFLHIRHSTLVEVLIAMALTVIVLMTLMFFYREVGIIGAEIDRTKAQDFYMRYIENRLADVIPKAISPTDQKKDFVFFSTTDEGITKVGSQSLIFTFDNGISLDKIFSNNDIGRLFLDSEGNLTLAYWPSPKRLEKGELPPIKKEILFENVDTLTFSFFVSPKKEKKQAENNEETDTKNAAEPEPRGDWREQPWLKEFNELPAMVKISIRTKDTKEDMTFIFPIPNKKTAIVYE